MAGDFSKKTQSDNKSLSNLVGGRKAHVDGSTASQVIRPGAGRLLRVIIFQKGLAFTIRDGSNIIGIVATTTPENDYNIGVYCENNITLNGISGTGDALIVFDE